MQSVEFKIKIANMQQEKDAEIKEYSGETAKKPDFCYGSATKLLSQIK